MTDPAASRTATRSFVAEFLRDADVACPTCGYNLRGAAEDRCPECGTAVHLEVAGSTSGAFWWLAASFGAALGVLILVVTLLHQLRDVSILLDDPRIPFLVQAGAAPSSDLPRWPTLIAITGLLSFFALGLAWLLTSRRDFGRMSRFTRITIGVTCSLAPVIVLGLLRLVILWT